MKIRTRKGKTPFIVEMTAEPKTKQIALSKGFVVGGGILNLNVERARSITDIASPYTAYDRNNLNVTYSRTLHDAQDRPLQLTLSTAGNLGGYNSKADPDEFKRGRATGPCGVPCSLPGCSTSGGSPTSPCRAPYRTATGSPR